MKTKLSDQEVSKGVIALWNTQYAKSGVEVLSGGADPLGLSPNLADLGEPERRGNLCSLLSDADQLVDYLDKNHKKPFDAIYPCPDCGDLHSWKLLCELLSFISDNNVRPVVPGSILDTLRQTELKPKGGLIVD